MARIELEAVAHSYAGNGEDDSAWALKTLNHVWEDGGAYALLGPSGCGKTTLLNIVSGLVTPSRGRVRFDGEDVTERPTERRNIAQVFQFPVIYDTMTVYDNLAFPLRNRRLPESETDSLVRMVADMLDLSADLRRRASNLPADAKQKLSLGRGLVRPDVAAILFDEPLTVIDPHLKWQLRRKLKQIHDRYRLTLVYVTHDQNEALTFADMVVVMYEGRILQVGTPQELFERPAHTFVGYFIGSPGMNLLDCTLEDGEVVIPGGRLPLSVAGAAPRAGAGRRLQIGARPESLTLHGEPADDRLAVSLVDAEDLGNFKIVTVRLGGADLKVKLGEGEALPAERAYLRFPPGRTLLYEDGMLVEAGR